jgi:aspartyl-tRNA synthetase
MTDSSGKTSLRSHRAGALRAEHAGESVRLGGWAHRVRDLGGLLFIDLRDRAGLVQVKFDPARVSHDTLLRARSVPIESVVLVEGEVAMRPPEMRNSDMPSGAVEVLASSISIVGPAETPAITVGRVNGENPPAEELRLRHRHLDLRQPELQANFELRHRLMQATRAYFSTRGFYEIETPILTRPTPEGARDYLVPSRVHPGEFYSLPQSPQIYKQLLMVSGFDRYFQIARCFRDEDLRADRQPEFTQIDVEASFIEREDIIALTEGMIGALWKEGGHQVPGTFPRMSYADAMERYGTDRPDVRYELEIRDFTDVFRSSEFGIATGAIERGGRVRGIVVPGGATLSRREQDELEAVAKSAGAGGLLRLKKSEAGLEGPAAKFLPSGAAEQLGLSTGDMALMVAADDSVSSPALDRVRQDVARRRALVPSGQLSFLWVLDFPLFLEDDNGRLASVHHPFTAPMTEDLPLLDAEPLRVRSQAYDVVLNGMELGGGSIRISDPALQQRVFAHLGIDEESARARFGFLLEGLRSGAPPHGGIAFGMDRIAMLLAGASSLRDVIAFPKTTAARALFEGAPSSVPDDELDELHIARRETVS